MCKQEQLYQLLEHFAKLARRIYSHHLQSLLLFGSYARGDYDNESDVDIMILVDIDKLEIKRYRNQLVRAISELELQFNLVISPIVLNASEYNQFKEASGFLRTVHCEGVAVIA